MTSNQFFFGRSDVVQNIVHMLPMAYQSIIRFLIEGSRSNTTMSSGSLKKHEVCLGHTILFLYRKRIAKDQCEKFCLCSRALQRTGVNSQEIQSRYFWWQSVRWLWRSFLSSAVRLCTLFHSRNVIHSPFSLWSLLGLITRENQFFQNRQDKQCLWLFWLCSGGSQDIVINPL